MKRSRKSLLDRGTLLNLVWVFFVFFVDIILLNLFYIPLSFLVFSVIVKAVYFFTNTNLPVKYVQPQKRKEKQKKTKQDKAKNTTEYD